MIHPSTELRFVNRDIGYGVFVTAPIPRGTVVWALCPLDIVLSPAQARGLPAAFGPALKKYSYTDGDGNCVVCWDHAKYVNHCCEPLALGVGKDFEIALRDIAEGEEITCEYGAINVTELAPCACGAANCRGAIRSDDVLRLWRVWDGKVAAALPFASQVEQPLLAFARDARPFWNWIHGAAPLPSHRHNYAMTAADCVG